MHRVPAIRSLTANGNYICPSCSRSLLRGSTSTGLRYSNLATSPASQGDEKPSASSRSWPNDEHATDLKSALKNSYLEQRHRPQHGGKDRNGAVSQEERPNGDGRDAGGSGGGEDASTSYEAAPEAKSQEPTATSLLEALRSAKASSFRARMKIQNLLSGTSSSAQEAENDKTPDSTPSAVGGESQLAPDEDVGATVHQRDGSSSPSGESQKSKNKKKTKSESTNGNRKKRSTKSDDTIKRGIIKARDLTMDTLDTDLSEVPKLSHGLERVLFNPGFYFLQDPRSRVYNFDPYLELITPVSDFDFGALKDFTPSSRDNSLIDLAHSHGKRYCGSTSSMSGILSHFHFLLSDWREINTEMLSAKFPVSSRKFTQIQRGPAAAILRWNEEKGLYAMDSDKTFSSSNILSMLGISLEKLLTLDATDFDRYRLSHNEPVPLDQRERSDSYHISTAGNFMFRAQLDARDPRLPGTGVFDLKTRAVIPIRMAVSEYEKLRGYEITGTNGEYESFEREYHDMIRATFLKYSMQVRMGRMDGIFVAYHNTERIFGFQYVPLSDMDLAVHGQSDLSLGDQEFKISLELLNRLLDMATERYPGTSLRLLCEMRAQMLYFFAEPVNEPELEVMEAGKAEEEKRYRESVTGAVTSATESGEAEDALAQDESALAAEEQALEQSLAEEAERESAETASAELDTEDTEMVTETAGSPNLITKNLESGELDGLSKEAELKPLVEDQAGHPLSQGNDTLQPDAKTPTDDALAEINAISLDETMAEKNEAEEQVAADGISASKPADPSKDVFAVMVKVQNKLDGKYVARPENVTAKRSWWQVEYQIQEVKDGERNWKLYQACKRRRELLLGVDGKRDRQKNVAFLRNLRQLSRKGEVYRQKRTQEEAGKEKVVLGWPPRQP